MDKVVNVNFRLRESDKKHLESACADMGMSVSTALTIFSKIVGRERRIPFEISADMFYSEQRGSARGQDPPRGTIACRQKA